MPCLLIEVAGGKRFMRRILNSVDLYPYQVNDSRPQTMRANFTDLSSVEKYVLPTETYEARSDSVLAWKKNQKLGRFDPNALSPEEALRHQVEKDQTEIQTRGSFKQKL
jgi:tubulin-folding cofactor B